MGPLLFPLAIRSVIKELSQLTTNDGNSLDMTTFYLDDGIMAGDIKVVAEALRFLEFRCPALR